MGREGKWERECVSGRGRVEWEGRGGGSARVRRG